MTKKDFIKIAANFKAQFETINNLLTDAADKEARRQTVRYSVADFCDLAADQNPRFDSARFLTACGM